MIELKVKLENNCSGKWVTMTKKKKQLWIKVGWSEFYQGGPVDGDYGYMKNKVGGRNERAGHEKYNFLPTDKGRYQIYVTPNGKYQSVPNSNDNKGWTVFCLSKNGKNGVHLVGLFKNCTLLGENHSRSEYSSRKNDFPADSEGSEFSYSIVSNEALLILPEYRQRIKHPSLTRSYMYLNGPKVPNEEKRQVILKELNKLVKSSRKEYLVKNPTVKKIEALEESFENPFSHSTNHLHRKEVETKAVEYVTKYYQNQGYKVVSHEKHNCGYDLLATKKKSIVEVEVKGTASRREQFFISRNERNRMNNSKVWKLAVITQALSKKPKLEIYSQKEVEQKFSLEALVYQGKRK